MPVEISQFIYGNSLVNYSGGSAQSNVPYWMNLFAETAGNTYVANGGYGFLRQFADRAEPADEWGFQGVDPLWDSESEPFEAASFDTVLITPGNFIQGRDVDADYPEDDRSPLDATLDIVRDTMAAQPDAQIYIYEGWADLGSTFGFPVSPAELDAYHAYNGGAYHDWYVDLVSQVNDAIPGANVELVPVASVLSELFLSGPLEQLGLADLYVDSAPHGTETVYFLASMITYQSTFGEPVPADFAVPDMIHPAVAENFDVINDQISQLLTGQPAEPEPEQPEPDLNTDPEAADDFGEIGQNEVLVLDLLANDSDPDADTLTLLSVGEAQSGSVQLLSGQAVYTPDEGFVGTDSFSYEISDGAGGTSIGRVEINVVAEEFAPEPETNIWPIGFSARYFDVGSDVTELDAVDFAATPVTTGTVDALQYVDQVDPFVPESGADHFAVQYDTSFVVTASGYHEIRMLADEEARLMIDGAEVLNTADVPAGDLVSVWLDLDEGRHDIQIQYLEVTGEQSLALDWRGPSTDDAIVPLTGNVSEDVTLPEPAPLPEPEPEPQPEPEPEEPLSPEDGQIAPESPKTEFAAKAFDTSAATLRGVNFKVQADQETVTNGVTLASEEDALLEGGPADGAVEFSTVLSVEQAGLYEIFLSTDDQASVTISGLPVVSAQASDAGAEQSNSIFLIAGQHPVSVKYLDTGGAQSLDVAWAGPDTDDLRMPLGDVPTDPLMALMSTDLEEQAEADLTVEKLLEDEAFV